MTEASKAGVALTGETVDTAANAQPGGPPPDGSKSTSDAASAGSHPDGAASTGSYQLYPFGLYRVADGAVIAVSAIPQSGDVQEIWLYHWREGENHLTPIARLTNGDGQYSWYAVGWDVVYFETRHLVEPAMTNFSGRQAMFTLADDRLHAIALGHWVQQAQARGDDLWFQPGGQMNWYRFTPNGLPPAP
ncbi:hypothetical protein [Alicyclobacillus sp.]|uniref:hypothetical protein n=1 Tax=Alicyclobacillus sp. TaxID=61169 RepID=UPI0025C1EAF0|nr:hypothetical protein [Alicyclobacillus sp.]MCL6515696.1 hypothetical protein [Alicyclobacillus sp.]